MHSWILIITVFINVWEGWWIHYYLVSKYINLEILQIALVKIETNYSPLKHDLLPCINYLSKTWYMKTPERWRAFPRCALLISILSKKNLTCITYGCLFASDKGASWCHTVTSRDVMTSHRNIRICIVPWKEKEHKTPHFSRWRPWHVTFDLQTHPRYCQGLLSYQILDYASARPALTDRHIDRTDFIPSTTDAGGKTWLS